MSANQKPPKEIRLLIPATEPIAYSEMQLRQWRERLEQWKIDLEKKKQYFKGYVEGSKIDGLQLFLDTISNFNQEMLSRFAETCQALDLSIEMVKQTMGKTMHLRGVVERMLSLPTGTDDDTIYKRAKEYGKILKYLNEKVAEEEAMRKVVGK